MTPDDRELFRDWTVGVRLWVERRGDALLGPGRVELLEAIERCHSISAAARAVGMSYRRAWLLVDSINRAAEETLVVCQTGGRNGGGAGLTDSGRQAIRLYHLLQTRMQRAAALPMTPDFTGPTPVHVAAAASLENVLSCLLADFTIRNPTITVRTIFGASDELASQILDGLHVDLFLSAEEKQLHRLTATGFVETERPTLLAANRLAAITAGSQFADLRSPRDLLQPAIKRIALASPSCPLGNYTRSYLEPLGLWQSVGQRAIYLDNPRVVVAAVESGQAQVGLVYRSDGLSSSSCRVLFTSHTAHPAIRYAAVRTHWGEKSSSASNLLAFLTSPIASRYWRRFGFSPPQTAKSKRAEHP